MKGVVRDRGTVCEGGEDGACHVVEVGRDVAVPQEEALWEVVELGGEDVRCEEVGEFVLGAGSVQLEDGLSAVQLVKEDGAVVLGFV